MGCEDHFMLTKVFFLVFFFFCKVKCFILLYCGCVEMPLLSDVVRLFYIEFTSFFVSLLNALNGFWLNDHLSFTGAELDAGYCFCHTHVWCIMDLQQRDLMAMVWCWFSEAIQDRRQMTKMFPKQMMKATTQTNTRRMMFASRFSKDEIPSVFGLQLRTLGEYPQNSKRLK